MRPFHLAWQASGIVPSRARRLIDHVVELTTDEVTAELNDVYRDFDNRHWQVQKVFERRYAQLVEHFSEVGQQDVFEGLSPRRRQLIGAYFCHEYSYAAAAMTNPGIVAHPDQSNAPVGGLRFLMSARTVGEGHISTIAFIEGSVGPGRSVVLDHTPRIATAADLARKPSRPLDGASSVSIYRENDCDLARTVIFPITATQSNGLEDLRMTPFDHGAKTGGNGASGVEWIGTYTAFNGREIRSELMRTRDFRRFDLVPMTGTAARNKGMALFPRKIGGRYAMIGRQDGENIFLLRSDTLTHWDEGVMIVQPRFAWEFVQMGNCGAPIETEAGWLLLTHGVGPMRRYAIGAVLLDRDDPSKVLGRTPRPVLEPLDNERDGYVPNVVYTCGAMRVGDDLFVPFGIADSSIGFAFVAISELLDQMVAP